MLCRLLCGAILSAITLVASAEILPIAPSAISSALYTISNQGIMYQTEVENDSFWLSGTQPNFTTQIVFLTYVLPMEMSKCEGLGFETVASGWSEEGSFAYMSGRYVVTMEIFPQSIATLPFEHQEYDFNYWGGLYDIDTVVAGQPCFHESFRTVPSLDRYVGEQIAENYPDATEIIIALAADGGTHYDYESGLLYWTYSPLSVDIPQILNQSISVFPNPFVNEFVIQGTRAQFSIYNLLGQKMFEGNSGVSIKLSYLPSGLYFLKFRDLPNQPIVKLQKIN